MILFHPLATTITEWRFNLMFATGVSDGLRCEMYVQVFTVDNNHIR